MSMLIILGIAEKSPARSCRSSNRVSRFHHSLIVQPPPKICRHKESSNTSITFTSSRHLTVYSTHLSVSSVAKMSEIEPKVEEDRKSNQEERDEDEVRDGPS
jgi:hypothetical protein